MEERELEGRFLEGYASAVLAWQGVEAGLFMIFSSLVDARPVDDETYVVSRLTIDVYYAVVNLNIRLGMTSAAAQVVLEKDEKLLERWKQLSSRVNKKAARRNELAHMSMVPVLGAERGREYQMVWPIWHPKRTENNGIDLKQLKEITGSFVELRNELHELQSDLVVVRARRRKKAL